MQKNAPGNFAYDDEMKCALSRKQGCRFIVCEKDILSE